LVYISPPLLKPTEIGIQLSSSKLSLDYRCGKCCRREFQDKPENSVIAETSLDTEKKFLEGMQAKPLRRPVVDIQISDRQNVDIQIVNTKM
jgi:hypothetical protein